jgi:hypothetical protein
MGGLCVWGRISRFLRNLSGGNVTYQAQFRNDRTLEDKVIGRSLGLRWAWMTYIEKRLYVEKIWISEKRESDEARWNSP